ncbi:LuxR C-terminal-related transcriptional regulator [Modestobacter sp. L9-4]|uniref:LuxR C-terminal-related transcriptional regulator n=1 Tax=Modestobacter sp. L9-4 TaxID=2851567 RepID=UPI001C7621B9|nr:LuxR C-terminal-related transcriptional regulator [Modestobacter sp. L9-4]QXG76409.1 LuxR C-terminal-related transcriptional regulator [Modestobacter sp. L9-4]
MTSTDGAAGPVLAVKLTVPPPPASLVPRPRLTRRLDAARDVPVTTVTAGAGEGKTTLLAAWASAQPAGSLAWVTLDAADDDPGRFWAHVVAALAAVAPAATARAAAALAVPSVDPLAVAVPELLNGLAAHRGRLVLVLDDVHEVPAGPVTEGLDFLVDHLPAPLHLVLGSRSAPPVGVPRLRARGRLAEVGTADLRLTGGEARELLSRLVRGVPDPAAVTGLLRRTEGWAAGLVLGGLALRDRAEGRTPPEPPGEGTAVEYLTAEVLERLPAQSRDLLLCAAALDRVSGSLCDAALDTAGSTARLAALDRDGVLVSATGGGWYRAHPLVRAAVLRAADSPARVADLQRRAADWSLQHGLPEEAVRARLAAGDAPGAAAVLVAHAAWFIAAGRVGVFAQLGDRLGPRTTLDVPLLVSLAWAAGVTGRLERVPGLLDRAERALPDADPGYPGFASSAGAIAALRSVYGSTGDPAAARESAVRAVDVETDPALPGWVVARVALGGALLAAGTPADARAVLEAAWSAPAVEVLPASSRLEVAGLLAWCRAACGDADAAAALLRTTAAEAAAVEEQLADAAAPAVALLHATGALLDERAGDLTGARRRSARAARLVAVQAHPAVAALVLVAAARVAVATREGAAALALLDQAREAVADTALDLSGPIGELTRQAGGLAAEHSRAVLAEPLTDREVSVLRALAGPLTRREVAGELHLSVNTVKGHVASLYRKLGVDCRADAVRRGRELGLG